MVYCPILNAVFSFFITLLKFFPLNLQLYFTPRDLPPRLFCMIYILKPNWRNTFSQCRSRATELPCVLRAVHAAGKRTFFILKKIQYLNISVITKIYLNYFQSIQFKCMAAVLRKCNPINTASLL